MVTGGVALEFHEVTPERWDDFERLFESPGCPHHCWCMVWREMPAGAGRGDKHDKKAAMESRVKAGAPVGILGYLDGKPVAWCSVAPRPTYRTLGGPVLTAEQPGGVWSIVCFFVPKRLRGQGLMPVLLQAAISHARSNGATVVEAYPVDPDAPSYRFMGFVPAFQAAGFEQIGRAGTRRHVMRLSL